MKEFPPGTEVVSGDVRGIVVGFKPKLDRYEVVSVDGIEITRWVFPARELQATSELKAGAARDAAAYLANSIGHHAAEYTRRLEERNELRRQVLLAEDCMAVHRSLLLAAERTITRLLSLGGEGYPEGAEE